MSDIPGWFDFDDLYREAVDRARDGAAFVECGTFMGRSADYLARQIAASGKSIHFDTWDSWQGVPPSHGYPGWTGQERLIEKRVRLALVGLPVHVRTGDAVEAARFYADASLDMVMLDDDHHADHVYAECHAWWPKVKAGGVLLGHDYDWASVAEGVNRWAAECGLVVHPVSVRSWQVRKP